MYQRGPASTRIGSSTRLRRFCAAVAAVLLLMVHIGLAAHSASHLHKAGKTGDCHLCVLGSHFVAETSAQLDLQPDRPVVVSCPAETETPVESALPVPASRGPPVVFV